MGESKNKTVFLYVKGDSYSAMEFLEKYNPKEFYQQMVEEDVDEKIINDDDLYAEVDIYEFGEVDSNFIQFIRDKMVHYDDTKHSDFFQIEL